MNSSGSLSVDQSHAGVLSNKLSGSHSRARHQSTPVPSPHQSATTNPTDHQTHSETHGLDPPPLHHSTGSYSQPLVPFGESYLSQHSVYRLSQPGEPQIYPTPSHSPLEETRQANKKGASSNETSGSGKSSESQQRRLQGAPSDNRPRLSNDSPSLAVPSRFADTTLGHENQPPKENGTATVSTGAWRKESLNHDDLKSSNSPREKFSIRPISTSHHNMVYPPPPPTPGERYSQGPLVLETAPPSPTHGDTGDQHYMQSQGVDVQLPSITSWAPPPATTSPPSRQSPRNAYQYLPPHAGLPSHTEWSTVPPPANIHPHLRNDYRPPSGATEDEQPVHGRRKKRSRQTRDAAAPLGLTPDDEEAGLALAGLGLGLGVNEMKARRDSQNLGLEGIDAGLDNPLGRAASGNKRAKKEETSKVKEDPLTEKENKVKDSRRSCSECRRLKAKCDRVFPCSNCRRRGCALVCPDGDLSCMQGKRLVLASTEELHERIAQLETALSQSHAKTGEKGLHPLLGAQFLDGGFAGDSPGHERASSGQGDIKPIISTSPKLPSSLNTDRSPRDEISATSYEIMTPPHPKQIHHAEIEKSSGHSSVEGDMGYGKPGRGADNHGRGRMALDLLLNENAVVTEGKREDQWVGENAAPAMIVSAASNSINEEAGDRRLVVKRLQKVLYVLPPREQARRSAENFWQTSSWYQNILRKEEYDTVYEPAVYAPTPTNPLSPHKLACVLMVLTLDSYLDISTDAENLTVARYWDAAQQCFDTRFGWAATVPGVQALALMTLFVGFGWRGARASNFYWLRAMTSAAQQLGLHKDPHPSLPEDEREFRRRVFHELYTLDCLISLTHGQRTAIQLENIETAYPANLSQLAHTKYEYMRLVKSAVIDIGLRPDTAPASKEQMAVVEQLLMKFDATTLPMFHCPPLCGHVLPPTAADPTRLDVTAMTLATNSMCHYKAMMFLYRPSLRRLIARIRASNSSQNHGDVVLTDSEKQTIAMTYGACHAIIMSSVYIARVQPRLAARSWFVWVQAFSAAVSVATIAIWCGPYLDAGFIGTAYKELSEACDMIRENGSTRSLGVLSLLPVLKSLVSNRYPQVVGQDPRNTNVSVEGEDMLFALLGGQVTASEARSDLSPSSTALPNKPVMSQQMSHQISNRMYQTQDSKHQQAAQNYLHDHNQPQQDLSHLFAPFDMNMGNNVGQNQISYQIPDQFQLPLVHHVPCAIPVDHFPLPLASQMPSQHQLSQHGHLQHDQGQYSQQQQNGGTSDLNIEDMDSTQLWARLQTFYEPTPPGWGVGVGVGVGSEAMNEFLGNGVGGMNYSGGTSFAGSMSMF